MTIANAAANIAQILSERAADMRRKPPGPHPSALCVVVN